ncbi:NAD(P)/FAD-dependent oxidoreductase [Novosphingobium sp.]|uniref:flavin-containing monooxygenase n=1 Tax=Novosphingobium sp. TaxID=1874826 RepID=UPI00260CA281|nr:NAD(P)/FAD-dependent oxidoreductase [Novosphingobium sp.]
MRELDVIVVGAGFAGLYALHKLRGNGLAVHAFEAADDVGGVWHWNRYPGARCDVESLQYSYSFDDALQQEWVWSERYAQQGEILAYLQHVADRFSLRPLISFGTRVTSAHFDAAVDRWHVTTDLGEEATARFCVMASGSLSASRLPEIPGIETFAGQILHTGTWPPGGVDFAGKSVAVIGTGSSGVQAIPQIARSAEQLVVLQRTPNFVVPARNQPLSEEKQSAWKAAYAEYRAQARQVGTLYDFNQTSAHAVSAQAREAEYRRRWKLGGVNFVHAFNDIMTDPVANQTAADFVHARIREVVNDPVTAEKLCPRGYPLGAKRICVGSDYYETFNRINVALIDLQATPVTAIEAKTIRTTEAVFAVDLIVCATGYDALTGALAQIDIRGRSGTALSAKWADGPRNYLGLMTADFPNMFIVTGPGSPSVLVNMVVGIEQHIDWIAACIQHLGEAGATRIEPEPEAEQAWVQQVNDAAAETLFVQANSWYLGANIRGKPRVFMPFVGGIGRYRAICDEVAASGYAGFQLANGD